MTGCRRLPSIAYKTANCAPPHFYIFHIPPISCPPDAVLSDLLFDLTVSFLGRSLISAPSLFPLFFLHIRDVLRRVLKTRSKLRAPKWFPRCPETWTRGFDGEIRALSEHKRLLIPETETRARLLIVRPMCNPVAIRIEARAIPGATGGAVN